MTKDGPRPKDKTNLKKSEINEFKRLALSFKLNDQGAVQTKYGLTPY